MRKQMRRKAHYGRLQGLVIGVVGTLITMTFINKMSLPAFAVDNTKQVVEVKKEEPTRQLEFEEIMERVDIYQDGIDSVIQKIDEIGLYGIALESIGQTNNIIYVEYVFENPKKLSDNDIVGTERQSLLLDETLTFDLERSFKMLDAEFVETETGCEMTKIIFGIPVK